MNTYIIKLQTKAKQSSYVELVAPEGTTAQTPMWFVSHWYGKLVVSDSESVRSICGYELKICLYEPARVLMTCTEATVRVRGLESIGDSKF